MMDTKTINMHQEINECRLLIMRMAHKPEEGSVMKLETEKKLQKIGEWLVWVQLFLDFFTKYFLKDGEYKKPGIWKWPGIIGALFILGLKLVGLFK